MILNSLIDLFLHLDKHLVNLTSSYGLWIYALIFLIIFIETGLVIMPFLPGDSLLFAAGALAALGSLNLLSLLLLLSLAAIIGDSCNYFIGHKLGRKAFHYENSWFFKKEHLIKTEKFYEKHGGKTIIIARFMPFIRTFAPFVAGIGSMRYPRFLAYNILGGVAWVFLFTLAGFFFGNIPLVKENFSLVIMAIILISIAPLIIKYIQSKLKKSTQIENVN